MAPVTKPLTVYLPDTRGVEISPFGKGNLKIGPDVYTFSLPAGNPELIDNAFGTCPGSTPECESICYAKRITGPVWDRYVENYRLTLRDDVPPLPADAELVRIHVSGDFFSVPYIRSWILRVMQRPDVRFWAYTRSWRVPALLPWLEILRAQPNMQLFASVDKSSEMPPLGWRIAWMEDDRRIVRGWPSRYHTFWSDGEHHGIGYICPEEVGRRTNCQECRYCFDGQKHDVVFLEH